MGTLKIQGLVMCGLMLLVCIGCGGGGGSSQVALGGGGGSTAAALSIGDNSILPGTLQNHAYSVTLHAVNAEGAVTWSIAPLSPTALFVNGLSIDPGTGVLSGTANFAGTAGFVATATDSASHQATKGFTITASGPLQAPPPQTFTLGQFGDPLAAFLQVNGGIQPLTFTVTGGSLPLGIRLNNQTGNFFGSAQTVGTFPFTVTIQDSFSPPEIVTAQVSIHVVPPALAVADSLPSNLLLNRPFSGKVVARGGIPPYHFSLLSGSLPPGLTGPDPSGGQVSGTPTALGAGFGFTVGVTDSSPTPQSAQNSFVIVVSKPLGRNDTVATATPIGNGQIIASISPYIDPPNAAPLAGDNDFYKLVSISGATVHVETVARRSQPNPLDTVIEIVDGNGVRQSTCRQPGDTSTTFTSSCINDDISAVPVNTDSALDYQVPGAPGSPTTFYVHVLDWRGDARPDMVYALQVSGAVPPMAIVTTALKPAARGASYGQQLTASNATGIVSWTLSGSLPPGLTLGSSGAITGTATTDGIYSFSIQAKDSSNPPQTASASETIQVVDPVKIISPAIWPDACVNTPYSFAIQTAGGVAPLFFGFFSNLWVAINMDTSTGVFSGSTSVTGTFSGTVSVGDSTGQVASQVVTLTVKQCP